MNSVNNHNLDKPFPGCLGRMVNLFDLGAGMPGNKLLSDKPHPDGSLRRSRCDVMRLGQLEAQIDNKVIGSEYGRNSSTRKSIGTPMKMLIAREMSKEVESKHNPPSVVAKLMGLDTLPGQEPQLATQGSHSRGYSRTNSDSGLNYQEQAKEFWDSQNQYELHNYTHPNEYKDVYEIMQQLQKPNHKRDKSPHKATCDVALNDRKVALVREKFIEAKRLSIDERLLRSPQFDDALEVLNSNKDIFLKFLQEPNSIFSQCLQTLQSLDPQHETKRITVLKPCKMVDNAKVVGLAKKNEKEKRKSPLVNRVGGVEKKRSGLSNPAVDWKLDENPSQPTRIVVLKPSSSKPHDIKDVVSPLSVSTRGLHNEELAEETDDSEAQISREVAKEITRQMCANLGSHCKDETWLSSVFSNGYVGDDSSFHKSEREYAAGNLSDSDAMSPVSRHSWDFVSRFDSPYSVSSFSRASYSPESSVCREAKKRLSERWAMIASTVSHQEQRHMCRSSSTLGEMLALSETKNSVPLVEEDNKDPKDLKLSCVNDLNKNEHTDKSSRNLIRSKSVPVSSTAFGTGIDHDGSYQDDSKTDALKEEASKGRSLKMSLKGKVSSLFLSRNRKESKGKSIVSKSKDESQTQETHFTSPGRGSNIRTQGDSVSIEDYSSPIGHGSSCEVASPDLSGKACMTPEAGLNVTDRLTYVNASENQDQPSPISVLETPFEEDERTGRLLVHTKYNLIDKSPPIGSIARTLSWDDSCLDTATSYPLQSSLPPQRAEEEERELFSFVQKLLSVAGLDGVMQSDTLLSKWHSSDSPLDPSFRDKYVDLNDKETMHESKRRQRRSTRKLVFDCVSAALLDMACCGPHQTRVGVGSSIIMVDQVWARMKEWFSGEERCIAVDCWDRDSNSLGVERVVRKEVVGKGWSQHLRIEMDGIEEEIERSLLDELLREALVELVGRA